MHCMRACEELISKIWMLMQEDLAKAGSFLFKCFRNPCSKIRHVLL